MVIAPYSNVDQHMIKISHNIGFRYKREGKTTGLGDTKIHHTHTHFTHIFTIKRLHSNKKVYSSVFKKKNSPPVVCLF